MGIKKTKLLDRKSQIKGNPPLNSRWRQVFLEPTFYLLWMVFLGAIAQAGPIDDYISYEQDYNVVRRLRSEELREKNMLSEVDKIPIPVNIYLVPLADLGDKVFLSQFIDSVDSKTVLTPDGRLLVPIFESNSEANQYMNRKYGKPRYTSMARKLLGRSSFYIESVEPSRDGFFVKFKEGRAENMDHLQREVLLNDYLKDQLLHQSLNSKFGKTMTAENFLLDSFAMVHFSLPTNHLGIAYRSAQRILRTPSDDLRVFPAHGLLGCDQCLIELSLKWLSTKAHSYGDIGPEEALREWKLKEYFPKLAKSIAFSHFILGVSFEAHTQNLLIQMNTKTGEINNFFFRDFSDILISPIPLISESRLPKGIDWQKVKLLSIHTNFFPDERAEQAKDIWFHFSIYTGQAITSHVTGFSQQKKFLYTFLKSYLLETEKIVGRPILLSEEAQKVMDSLNTKGSKDEFYSGTLEGRSPLRNAMASVAKSIFDTIYSEQVEGLKKELVHFRQSEALRASEGHETLAKRFKLSGEEASFRIQAKWNGLIDRVMPEILQVKDAVIQKINHTMIRRAFFDLLKTQRVVFLGNPERTRLIGESTKEAWQKFAFQDFTAVDVNKISRDRALDFILFDERIWVLDQQTQSPLALTLDTYSPSYFSSQSQPRALEIGPHKQLPHRVNHQGLYEVSHQVSHRVSHQELQSQAVVGELLDPSIPDVPAIEINPIRSTGTLKCSAAIKGE